MGSILGVGVNKLYGPCHTHLSFDYSFLLQTVKYSLYSTGGFFTYQFPNFPYGRRYTFGFDEDSITMYTFFCFAVKNQNLKTR